MELRVFPVEKLIEQAEAAELLLTWISMCLGYWYDKDYRTQSLDSYDNSEEEASKFDGIVDRISVLSYKGISKETNDVRKEEDK